MWKKKNKLWTCVISSAVKNKPIDFNVKTDNAALEHQLQPVVADLSGGIIITS